MTTGDVLSEAASPLGEADFFGNQRFALVRALGEGAFGVVYEALDRLRDTRVALKVLRRLGPDALYYFKKEFRALADIHHPNLIRYQELFEEHGRWFLTMELIDGCSIVEYVRGSRDPHGAGQRYDDARLRAMLGQLTEALDALHRAGKFHRDVKPSNLRVTEQGRLVVLDFGLVLDAEAVESSRLGQMGTAAYMSPEQVQGNYVGTLADFYAVGSVLYECLAGRHPFVGEPFEVLAEKQRRDPARPSELGAIVAPDLEELCMALLSRDLERRRMAIDALRELLPRAAGRRLRAPLAAAAGGELVGRARELSALKRAFDALETGGPRVASVYGESGIGKSALLAELGRRVLAARPETLVLAGRCHEREAVPFKAFDGILDALAGALRHLPEARVAELVPAHAELLVQAFPVLGRVSALRSLPAAETRSDAQTSRRRAFAALGQLLSRLAAERPLLILLDDVHWADRDSVSLFSQLVAGSGKWPGLFVLSGRPRTGREDPGAALEQIVASRPNHLKLRLSPLSDSDTRALARSLLAAQGLDTTLADVIAHESAGQPLFVLAMVRRASQGGTAGRPAKLDDALRASMEELSAPARELLATLAIAGAPLTWEVLSRATQQSPSQLILARDVVLATRWVRSSEGERAQTLEFAHDRVRQVVLSSLSVDALRHKHGALGDALARVGVDPEAAALHWVEAGQMARVPVYARRAAEAAVAALAFDRAIQLYELALVHAAESDRRLRRELTVALAEALLLSGRVSDAAERYLALSQESAGLEALELRQKAIAAWLDARALDRGLPEAQKVLAELGITLPRTRAQLARSVWLRRVVRWFRPLESPAADPAEVDVRERVKADVLFSLTTSLTMVDELRAAELQARHLDVALALGDPYRASRALALEAWFVIGTLRGRDPLASRELARARELARQTEHPHAPALLALVEGVAGHLDGRFQDAERSVEQAEQLLRECTAVRWERTHLALLKLMLRLDTGAWREVSALFDQLLAGEDGPADETLVTVMRSRVSPLARLLADDPEGAQQEIAQLRRALSEHPIVAHKLDLLQAETDLDIYHGDPNAFARVERGLRELERQRLLRIRSLLPRVLSLRGRAALASAYLLPHRRPQLVPQVRRDAEALSRGGALSPRALGAVLRAGAAEVAGERERAIALFGEAVLSCEEVGMPQLAAAARRRQGILLGGEEGRAMVLRAERWLREQGAVDPARVAALLVGYG